MPLQKSFSDQNHSAKQKGPRQQWSRNRSYAGPQLADKAASRPLQEKPPIPVSTATKNKLSQFQFGGKNDSDTTKKPNTVIDLVSDNEKENETVITAKPSSKAENKRARSQEEKASVPELLVKDVPKTPAGRLALPDLMGIDEVKGVPQDTSPDERIEWDHNKDMIHSSASSFSGVRRARKRARSSSPMSPPAQASHTLHLNNDVSDSQPDPGSELWGRYSLHSSNAVTPQGQPNPSFLQIIQTSSPQPSKDGTTPRLIAGFRRANSCGNQFPKRRRLGVNAGDDVFTESANIGPSKLSVLIERVQEGLVRPAQATLSNPPSATSITPSNRAFDSASHQRIQDAREDSHIDLPPALHLAHAQDIRYKDSPAMVCHSSSTANSSDYGEFDDDDLDESLLEAVCGRQTGAILDHENISTTYSTPGSFPTSNGSSMVGLLGSTPEAFVPPKSHPTQEHDEFGDLEDETFTTDLENIVSQIDNAVLRNEHDHQVIQVVAPSTLSRPIGDSQDCESDAGSDDEFGDCGLDEIDFATAEASATQSILHTQSINSLLPLAQKSQAIQRYLVTNILDSEYETASGRKQKEKILLLQIDQAKTTKVVHLRGTWIEAPVTKKAFVHVIGSFSSDGRCIIDDTNNILILHPDHLISSLVVADSFGCVRRAVLQDRVKATSAANAPLLYGTILHEIFQAAMLANRWDTEWLGDLIEEITAKHLEDLYTIKLQISQATEYLLSKMSELQAWAELFVSSQPKSEAIVQAGNGEKANMCVSKLLDIEEHVWSPMYGLKGNIDATVQVTMKDGNRNRTLTVPFEVKTGKNPTAAHRAQTALYSLLISDRYDIEIAYGILYYMETSQTIRIPTIRRELLHMIMQRNELACFVRERHAQLPPMLRKENMCDRCYAKVPCFTYHKLVDDGTGETSGMNTKFDDVVKHLTPKHKEFFMKWDDLLTKEEKECLKFRRELWTMLSVEREKVGRCFSNVIIEPGSAFEDKTSPKINRYNYNMTKQDHPLDFSFLESQITIGEPIVISDEEGHFALAKGYVTHIRKQRITVAVDRRLHNARIRQPGFDEVDNQVFASIMEVEPEGSINNESEGKIVANAVKYRLDKDEFSNGMATVRNNLIQVMAEGPYGSREIRSLVVDLNAPRFKTQPTAYVLKDRENINIDQRRAIQKVMSAQDYALVLGMPGTGKTTTIAHIIRALVSQGKSVLLTSYTHSAVDNILLKLKDDAIPILRLGNIAKVHPEVQEFATLAATPKNSFEEIKSAWHDTPIVATTCLAVGHAIFNERTFDYCIVDEASQITLPVCLGPIRMARTFILVGDHNQLPPLVQNEEARKGGLDISLFKHLSDMNPTSVVYLEHQYRMCEDVMSLSNHLIYNGRLKCGSKEVAARSISIPDMAGLRDHHISPSTLSRSQKSFCSGTGSNNCWIRTLVDPATKVAFINTDPLLPHAREEAKTNRIVNHTEARICIQLVKALLSVGVPASNIGVMTHYRSQLALLRDGLRSHQNVEMHTADRFQGRDKEVIILSLVRSNESKSIGELLKDWRRINVAFTRAKTKLLVIGSRETLKGNGPNANGEEEMVAKFVTLMEDKQWIFDLPKSALEDHYFEDSQTQATASCMSALPASTLKKEEEQGKKKKTPILEDSGTDREKENRVPKGAGTTAAKRLPNKKISGNKPFKIPQMSVMKDVLNEVLY